MLIDNDRWLLVLVCIGVGSLLSIDTLICFTALVLVAFNIYIMLMIVTV